MSPWRTFGDQAVGVYHHLLRHDRDIALPVGFVTLGQVAARLSVLEVACNRCDRRGRLHVARLLAEHGPALPMPDLRCIIAVDCLRMIAGHVHDVCGVHFPGLVGLDLV
jgi:hypothetical protein